MSTRRKRKLTSLDDLRALPEDTVIREQPENRTFLARDTDHHIPRVLRLAFADSKWGAWEQFGPGRVLSHLDVVLPAIVLWRPEEDS